MNNEKEKRDEEEEEEEETGGAINLSFSTIWRTVFHEIVTRNEIKKKTCAPVLVKRNFINNRYFLPYGFKKK